MVLFADSKSPWQRGAYENTNGPLGPTLSEGERSLEMVGRGRGSDRTHPQHQAAENARLAHPCRSLRRELRSLYQPGLRPPIESAHFRTGRFVHALGHCEMVGSTGHVGAAGDNAAMEGFFAQHKEGA